MEIRTADTRGKTRLAWLDSKHSFSFGHYYDPRRLGYGALRVINDDWVAPGAGFDTHGHRDMEIITYMLSGELLHRDSMGNHFSLKAGEIQMMRAGTGVAHSEFNGSKTQPATFLQIWIEPNEKNLTPHYEQFEFNPEAKRSGWVRLVAPQTSDVEGVKIAQDAWIWATELNSDSRNYSLGTERNAYLHVVKGTMQINGETLTTGDAALVDVEGSIEIVGTGEVLLFDLAKEQ